MTVGKRWGKEKFLITIGSHKRSKLYIGKFKDIKRSLRSELIVA